RNAAPPVNHELILAAHSYMESRAGFNSRPCDDPLMPPEVVLRPATADDWDWIVSEVPRLREFGPPPWRTPEQMDAGEIADLRDAFEQLDDPDRLLLIAARA